VGRAVRSLAPKPLPRLAPEQVLFVNVHPRDLMDPELTSPDATLSGVADRVVLEITERAALEMVRDLLDTIAALRQRGFRIAVDDLGSGFAGLTSFAVLEPDIVKLDMALIRDVDTSTTKQKLVKSVVDLCHDLGVVVVGEGVETFAERAMCASLGVDLLQGFLLARPGRPFPEVTW
jgi:EAL domain-containing protein (putative c-di-GMP-specific phosphodiesterase class I)